MYHLPRGMELVLLKELFCPNAIVQAEFGCEDCCNRKGWA